MQRQPAEALEQIRSTYPEGRKSDGKRVVRLTFREQAFVDIISTIIDHVAERNGMDEISETMCKGCTHGNEGCPTAMARVLLKELKGL